MANEYSVNQADLIAVADAIRTKGKTTDAMMFPEGFVAAVEGIKGGGVTAEAYESEDALPSSATDGEIAVISSTAVGEVYVQNEEPGEPQEGDVWVTFVIAGNVPVVAGNVTIYPMKAFQYIDGVWASVDMKMYKDGEWVAGAVDTVIYMPGNEAEDITGGWEASSSLNLRKETTRMAFDQGFVSTAKKIDLTPYSLLSVYVQCPSGAWSNVGVGNTQTEFVASTQTGMNESAPATRTVPLDGLEGEYYILLESRSASTATYVYKVELIV